MWVTPFIAHDNRHRYLYSTLMVLSDHLVVLDANGSLVSPGRTLHAWFFREAWLGYTPTPWFSPVLWFYSLVVVLSDLMVALAASGSFRNYGCTQEWWFSRAS